MFTGSLLQTLVAEKELVAESEARSVRMVKPKVVEPEGLADLETRLFRPGTIVFLVAEESNSLVQRLLEAIANRDVAVINAIGLELRKLEEEGLGRIHRPSVLESKHLVDILYDRKTVARGLAPSLVSVAVSQVIWDGGSLNGDKFVAADYTRGVPADAIEVVAVLVKPRLSELEAAMVRAVPAEIDEVNLKEPLLSWTPVAQAGLQFGPFGGGQGSPLFQNVVEQKTQQQVQQQQEDKQIQQQQQQQQQENRTQQQQQQQQQDRNQTVQQQAQQQQDANQGQQQQQQQQQDAQTHQDQQQNRQDAQTHQEREQQQGERGWLDNDRQGASLGSFDKEAYLHALLVTDFAGLDATQSVRVLLALREQFLLRGMP